MNGYHISQKMMHWLSALFILSLFALGVWMRTLDYYSGWYQTAPELHKSFGIMLIGIMILRSYLRLKSHTPKPLNTHQAWEVKTAHVTHIAMYALIAIILVSGYLIGTADNRGIAVFDVFDVPPLFTAFENQEDVAGFIHEWAAYCLMGLVALHIAGALKHHLIDKDKTLKRML